MINALTKGETMLKEFENEAMIQLSNANLPDESRIVRSIEEIVGIEPRSDNTLGHDTIPFLNDLCRLRGLQRKNGEDVPAFRNALLEAYEMQRITETGLWERFENAARMLR